jgi:hypothetical protein
MTFPHRQSAHCESGVVANMLTAAGCEMSEPMAFGLSSSLTFAYLPMVKMAGLPLVAYRGLPGSIRRGVERVVGGRWEARTYSDPERGMAEMDAAIDRGRPVGVQTGIYWLPYVPEDMRFHFNAHNLVVSHRDGADYIVSDPVFPDVNRCDRASLKTARFVRGVMAPHGRMYWLEEAPKSVDHARIVPIAVRRNAKLMLAPVFPMVGINGIRHVGRMFRRMGEDAGAGERLKALLGHVVRMQEEIGTGGAGFRFLYAAFLKESAERLDRKDLADAATALTDVGDEWRRFALEATKMCRGRMKMDMSLIERRLNDVADREDRLWRSLAHIA